MTNGKRSYGFSSSIVGSSGSLVNMSEPRLKISSLVIERLSKIQEVSSGRVFGVKDDGALSILGFCVTEKKNPSGDDDKVSTESVYNHDIIPNLPANTNLFGVFTVCSTDDVNNWEKKFLKSESKSTPVLLIVDLNTHAITAKLKKDSKYEKVEYDTLTESYWKKFVHFHLNAKFLISCNFDSESVKESFSLLQKKINQGIAFQLKGTQVFILENGASGADVAGKTDVEGLKSILNTNTNNILKFNMFLKSCCDPSNPEVAPVIKYEKKSFKSAKINLIVDALSIVDVKTKLNKLYDILLESVRRNLALNEDCLVKQFKHSDPNKISLPQIYHFFPQKCGHFVSIAYPKKQMEDQLLSTREVYHKILALPMDIPLFRRGNVYSFLPVSDNPSTVLTNPHEGLNPSGVPDGEVSLVQGVYGYHHYMQDGVDDNGWGCAYRSLQTIVSWFRHQGFTSRPIPTHREIQQCLVDIGDKPSSFVGSRNWIGSTEVSFVLDTLLSVSSRIVSVSSGEELSMKGGELSHHFKTQGTPIMIGGGVLAHTILGVDYNRKTGALKFLILDPHYTGEEDLTVIQGKGWCGWKGMDFWKKNAFYNMCLPLRPKSI